MNLIIRPAQSADVSTIASIHLASFPGFFLSFLGEAFLRELYRAIMNDPSGIAYVCVQSERIIGFVFGTVQPSGLYRRLLRQRWWRFGLAAIVPVLKQASIIRRLARAIYMPQQASNEQGIGTLMSIAVLPNMQTQGAGKALVNAFLHEATQRKLKKVNLTTDKIDNDSVNLFYQKLGFNLVRYFTTPEGRQMNEYMIEL